MNSRYKYAWGKFCQLLPLLINRHLPLFIRGKVYSPCVGSAMLHAAEKWVMIVDTLNRLRCNDRGSAMSGQKTKLAQTPFSQSLAPRTEMWCFTPVR